jgi:hypothetical protein
MEIIFIITCAALIGHALTQSYIATSKAADYCNAHIDRSAGALVAVLFYAILFAAPVVAYEHGNYWLAFQITCVVGMLGAAIYVTLKCCARIERAFSQWYNS